MAYFQVQEKGLKEVLGRINKLRSELKEEVIEEIHATALDIQGDAREALQGGITDYGRLAQSIQARKQPNGVLLVAGSGVVYAPYIEWGTGKLVQVPDDEKSYAILFKGKGIREVNTNPRPYFFPAVKKNLPLLLERLKKIIRDDT